MQTKTNETPPRLADIFGEPISVYTRAQALDDGFLVDVSKDASEAGFRCPVALTRNLWEDAVAWDEEDSSRKKTHQDEAGRLWDVVYMASLAFRDAIRSDPSGHSMTKCYDFYRVPRAGTGRKARRMTAKIIAGPGDHGELVVTIMLPDED